MRTPSQRLLKRLPVNPHRTDVDVDVVQTMRPHDGGLPSLSAVQIRASSTWWPEVFRLERGLDRAQHSSKIDG